jgi:hypothetical protein
MIFVIFLLSLSGKIAIMSNENVLNYWYELYLKGLPISKKKLQELSDNKYDIKEIVRTPIHRTFTKKIRKFNFKPKRDFTVLSKGEKEVESKTELKISTEEFIEAQSEEIITEPQSDNNTIRKQFCTITDKDWRPKSVIVHTDEFYKWIDSINSDYPNQINYTPFNLYVQQCEDWLAENEYITDYHTQYDRSDFVFREMTKCDMNTLYFANKYGWLQEPSLPSGRRRYITTNSPTHVQAKIILYLKDCKYSVILGKPRQIKATSTIGLSAVANMIFKINHSLNYIAEDKETGLKIFAEKILYPYSQLPDWLKKTPLNDREGLLKIPQITNVLGSKKVAKRGDSSKIQIMTPTKTAINSGSPQEVNIDEIGSLSILEEMVNEDRPTMFVEDEITHELSQRRVLWLYGTGTSAKGGAAFEKLWTRISGLWAVKDEQVGMIPLFFNWRARCDEDHYNREKKVAYGARSKDENIDAETAKIQFHQAYPSTPADMFVQTGKTIIGRAEIEGHVERIHKKFKEHNLDVEYGYFEPVFDLSKPIIDQDVPFKIIDAKWIKTGYADERASSIMLEPPNPNWLYRYYAGTDPISNDTGVSKMATVIWDEHLHTIQCIVNTREPNNPNYSFMQSMLATIYYDREKKQGCPEIVERNISVAYRNYRETKGFIRSLLIASEIMPYFQSGEKYSVGIENNSHRSRAIINQLGDALRMYGENIYHEIIFQQTRNFVCTITRNGNEQWASIDKRFYMDDTLFGLAYAFICALSSRHIPKDITAESKEVKTVEYDLGYDANWNMIRIPKIVKKVQPNV